MEGFESFRLAGATLFSLGLVKDTEGNLSVFDGSAFRITSAGAPLGWLQPDDLVDGDLARSLVGASSDLTIHRQIYSERGPGAVVHAHPPGTSHDGGEWGEHGVYTFASTLEEAVAGVVRTAREHVG